MSAYTIRIELHDATWQNYVDLANDLARVGVTDLITASNGTTYKMPPAEYNYEGQALIDQVLNAAKAAADRTGRANAVFVTEAAQRKWVGLAPVPKRRSA